MRIRSSLYRAGSLMGWAGAAAKGPGALLVRFFRAFLTAGALGLIARLFR